MDNNNFLPFDLPAVARKKVTAAFDGGRLSSDGGVMLLRDVERRVGLAGRLAGGLTDRRDLSRIDHEIVEMLRLRMFLIAAGYEGADDCDSLRADPVFKMAVGRLPETGPGLCSQPTMSRLENAPSKIEIARMMVAMIDVSGVCSLSNFRLARSRSLSLGAGGSRECGESGGQRRGDR